LGGEPGTVSGRQGSPAVRKAEFGVLSAYLVVGTLLEERKLVIEFGEESRRYQSRVSMFIPVKWLTARQPH
jgi:hypothetical protein